MAKKHKHSSPAPLTIAQLQERIGLARHEGRFQHALELSKQLYSREATPAHRELLLNVYLARAQQLRQQGHPHEAETVLDNILRYEDKEPAWLEKVSVELAACGNVRRALQLLERVPNAPIQADVLRHAVDTALMQAPAGRALLPETLQPAFDLIVQAFRQLEAGQDDAVRETLQGIGLASPFLEWKLLLRGLQAYYQNEDVRALENWSRLGTERAPARLAAPLRALIDPEFRARQTPETQAVLRRQADRIQGGGLVTALRGLQKMMGDGLASAFRTAEQHLSALRRERPDLVPRLASCFYWAIIHNGEPRDLERYRRLFGAPADDPQLTRLEALALEERHDLLEAHRFWQQYEQSLANHPAFPGELGKRARALVWSHMGDNAASIPDAGMMKKLPAFLRNDPDRPEPLKPTAEQCFKRSLDLAPDQLAPHEALVSYYQTRGKDGPAEKAARKLLEHFPEHVPTLLFLGDHFQSKGQHTEALGFFERALKANPLDRRLRNRVSVAHSYLARAATEAGDFEQGRAEYQAALAFDDGLNRANLHCKWAACEFKADNAERAEELLRQVEAPRLAIAYHMLIEAIRFVLPKPLKTRFENDFTTALSEPAEPAAATAAVDIAAALQHLQVSYRGQKTHEKKVLTYLDRVPKNEFTESQLKHLGIALLALKSVKAVQKYAKLGGKRYPHCPHFPLLEAQSLMPTPGRGRRRPPSYWQLEPLLQKAERLAHKLPAGDEQKTVLDEIEKLKQLLGANDMLAGFMGGPLFEMFGMGDEDDWNED